MDERDKQDPLRNLEERLERARRGRPTPRDEASAEASEGESRNALAIGMRIGLELVGAVIVGGGFGWALDRWLGTRPGGMILFLFLGIGVGMWNVYRAVTGMGMAMGFRRGDRPAAGDRTNVKWADEDED
jgi:ATP synthase protein I